jgi:hypothetical protein
VAAGHAVVAVQAMARNIMRAQVSQFIQAVWDSDRETVDETILRLSRSRP